MKSFGIGLAILLAGAAIWVEAYALRLFTEFAESFGQTPTPIAAPGIWERLIPTYPYICLGVMAFGVLWYWIVEPTLYFRRRKEGK